MDAKPQGSPRRRPGIGAVVSVLVVLAALSLLLVLWSPWSQGEMVPNPDGSTTPGSSASSSREPTGPGGSTTSEASPSRDEPTSPGPSGGDRPTNDADAARVPTVVGMPVQQAAAEVEREFDDVRLVADPNGAGEACVVFAQNPDSGAYPPDTPVTLTYAGTAAECGVGG